MDFSTLNSVNLTSILASNNTANPLALLPSTILESFLPGYSFLSQLILRLFGIDIALVVAGGLLLVGLEKAIMYLWNQSYGVFSTYFVSSVHIEKDDEMFTKVMEWVAEQQMAKEARHVRAVTKYASAWDDDEETSNLLEQDEDLVDERGMFNFEKWASNIPPRFEPTHGNHRFWHHGRLFFFERAKKDSGQKISWYNVPEDEYLVVSCIGRRPEPVKEWLNHVKNWSLGKNTKYTSIRRACASEHSDCSWDTVLKRPSRPMQTVILDKAQKMRIVEDINEYLHPATARWYAARGIPYRRGYLFYGPPGTGKTSLSFALAGIFGLDIYCVSLMEPSLKESDLLKLFSELPRRCIVLLEDIDSAGLRRPAGVEAEPAKEEKKADKEDKKSKKSKDEDEDSGVDVKADDSDDSDASSKPSGAVGKRLRVGGPQSQISLSGLLNAIDGVATHEGRVLIMTTNHVETLDAALLRPGRVDMQIKFTLATKQQARDIFIRMYSVDESERARHASQLESGVAKKKIEKKKIEKRKKVNEDDEDDDFAEFVAHRPVFDMLEPKELRRLADRFAELVPENKFSPAELQGFLLMRKKEPLRAVEEIAGWRDRTLAAKESGLNVIDGV